MSNPMMNNSMMINMQMCNMLNQLSLDNKLISPNQIQMLLNNLYNNQMTNNTFNEMDDINFMIEKKFKEIEEKKYEECYLDYNLVQFLGFVCFNKSRNEEFKNNDNKKLILNYYDLIKVNIYLDLNLKIKDLIPYIFWQIFYHSNLKKLNKRTKKSQTTEYVIKNPISEPVFEYIINYQNFLFLEYNKKSLSSFSDKTGYEIGLKEGDEILLKLKQDFYKELSKLLKCSFYICYNDIKNTFFFEETEIASIRIDKIFNRNKCKLLINGEELTGKKELIISKNINIPLIDKYNLIGRGDVNIPISFIDVSTGKVKELKFSKNAPDWRKVNKGLNIFGICKNPKCQAFKEEVVYKTNLSNEGLIFDLNKEIINSNITCPICLCNIKIKTCGFYKCEYQFIGKKIEPGKEGQAYYESKPKETNGDKFEYFDPDQSNEVIWIELKIYVLPKQEIKYQEN